MHKIKYLFWIYLQIWLNFFRLIIVFGVIIFKEVNIFLNLMMKRILVMVGVYLVI